MTSYLKTQNTKLKFYITNALVTIMNHTKSHFNRITIIVCGSESHLLPSLFLFRASRTTYQVIPIHENLHIRRTLFDGYLFKYCFVKYQTFHQVSEKTSQENIFA